MRHFLEKQGVTFVDNCKITDFVFKDTPLRDEITVTGLKYERVDKKPGDKDHTGEIKIDPDDFVFDTNGSITDSSSIGDMDTPIKENMEYAASAQLWKQAANHFFQLGQPDKFFNDREQSEWCSFTVTAKNHYLLNEIARITEQQPGNALNTFVDSNELLSIVVHHQPHFHAQKENETIFWGYSLYPRQVGDYVDKPFIEMTGREMLEEFIGQLAAIDPSSDNIRNHMDKIMDSIVNVIPVYMPICQCPL